MKIRVAGHEYTLKWMSTEWGVDTEVHGTCCRTHQLIKIRKGMPPDRTLETLMHEIGHAIYYEYGLCNILTQGFDAAQVEEIINSTMSTGWFQVLKDNRHIAMHFVTPQDEHTMNNIEG